MAQLDHIVVVLPHKSLENIPESISSKFTVVPGIRAANGTKENKWIILPDGTMFELVAYIDDDPKNKKGHFWGALPTGIVDMGLTTSLSNEEVNPINAKLRAANAPIVYGAPQPGGRPRPGQEPLHLTATWAENVRPGAERLVVGQFPFWQHDLQDRMLRCPLDNKAWTTHPSGAIGVKDVILGVPFERLAEFKQVYQIIAEKQASGLRIAIGTPAGEDCNIILEPFNETYARILRVTLWTKNDNTSEGVHDKFDGGNVVNIDFAKAFRSSL